MMKKLSIIVLILLGVYGCWQFVYPSGSFNYKLTLVVDDNGKQIIASGVREVTIAVRPGIILVNGNYITLKGEAVAIDLGEKGVLFSLLGGSGGTDAQTMFLQEFMYSGSASKKGIEFYKKLQQTGAKKELAFDKLPMLVRFKDINDPKTVEKIDPNDLEKTFGKGVKLVSATLEMTDEGVTNGVEKWLPWIREYYSRRLDGDRYGSGDAKNRLANDLASGDFSANMGLSKY